MPSIEIVPGKTRIGWIGTGVMGRSMCGHLIDKGFAATVFTRTKSKADDLVAKGAAWAASPQAVAEKSDVIFSIVGFPSDVREVMLGSDGALAGSKPENILVDMTTSEPSLAVEIYEAAQAKGVQSVDAPVSGGDVGAKEARLSIMIGGDKDVVDALNPCWEAMGKTIVHQGPAGAGQHTKMVNQTLIATLMIGVCEGLLYGYKAGLDLETVMKSVASGAAGSWSLSNLGPRVIANNFDPGFFVEHFIKDMGIALAEAKRMDLSLPGLALAHSLYIALKAQGHGRDGTHALQLALASLSGVDWKNRSAGECDTNLLRGFAFTGRGLRDTMRQLMFRLLIAQRKGTPLSMRSVQYVSPIVIFLALAAIARPASGVTDADYAQHILALKQQLPEGFHILIEKPFVVVGDESLETVQRRAKSTVRWSVDRLKELYFENDPDHIINVWLFKDKESYEKHAWDLLGDRPSTPYGYYSPRRKALVMNISTGGGTLVHEIVHPFVAANFSECPSWFNEGLGSLYEQCGDRDGRITGFTNWRLRGLQKAIAEKRVPPFATLCATTTDEFYNHDKGTNYAQARYLCHYLQEQDLLVKYYHAFRKSADNDPSGYKTLTAVLGEDDMPVFQKRWEEWVMTLKF